VTDHQDKLREAFESHEHLAPDPAVVYARVQELAKVHRWRRRGAQVAGGAMVGAGLIAGALTVPGMLPARQDSVTMVAPAAPATSPSPSPSALSDAELAKGWAAYFDAGYDYDDAVELAKLWKSTAEIGTVKAEAGLRLLAGETLPIRPKPANVAAAKEAQRVEAFFDAGYDYDDAVRLANLWKLADAYQAKVEGGKRLLAGDTLPIKP
jgi:hypothetical protein